MKPAACLAITIIALLTASTSAVTISTVRIGHPGNPADARYVDRDHPSLGSVPQAFDIGRTEVTNAQYVEFLNAVAASDPHGLYNANMASLDVGALSAMEPRAATRTR